MGKMATMNKQDVPAPRSAADVVRRNRTASKKFSEIMGLVNETKEDVEEVRETTEQVKESNMQLDTDMETNYRINKQWKVKEYYNPPRAHGVQYRTTERWNGKPVYERVISLGKLPNATRASYPVNLGYSSILPIFLFVTPFAQIEAFDGESITVKTISDMSAYTGYLHIKYVEEENL